MTNIMKGNFKTKKEVASHEENDETLEDRFEKEALSKLGGSIAFVSKKKILWSENESTD